MAAASSRSTCDQQTEVKLFTFLFPCYVEHCQWYFAIKVYLVAMNRIFVCIVSL